MGQIRHIFWFYEAESPQMPPIHSHHFYRDVTLVSANHSMEPPMNRHHALILAALLTLTACGANKSDRAIGGAAIGAGTGALIGSTVGAAGTGALIGAGVGVGVGAMTDIDTINLGKPWWK